jgi:hypothetical protein
MACSINGLRSFPIGINITPTDEIYNKLKDSSYPAISVEWGTRSKQPSFTNTTSYGGVLDDTESSTKTSLQYNGNTYTLMSAQVAAATHNGWIVSSARKDNKEDLVLIFSTSGTVASLPRNTLIIIIPILRTGTSNPAYLSGIITRGTPPYSLESCMPSGLYAIYSTCLDGYVLGAASQSAAVFVHTVGLPVSPELISGILSMGAFGTTFPVLHAPFMTSLTSANAVGSDSFPINRYVITASPFTKALPIPPTETVSTDNYKCTPLDASTIVDGKIKFDTATGKTLTQVIAPSTGPINPGKFERGLSITLGVILGILFFGIGFYFLSNIIAPTPATSGPIPVQESSITTFLKTNGVALGMGAVGLLAGYTIALLS